MLAKLNHVALTQHVMPMVIVLIALVSQAMLATLEFNVHLHQKQITERTSLCQKCRSEEIQYFLRRMSLPVVNKVTILNCVNEL